MTKIYLVEGLVTASLAGDTAKVKKWIEAMISEETNKGKGSLADHLQQLLDKNQYGQFVIPDKIQSLIQLRTTDQNQGSLLLQPATIDAVNSFINQYQKAYKLHAAGIKAAHTILLTGPPGNGKTSLAETIANRIGLPLLIAPHSGLIGPYLGETASRIDKVFKYAATSPCVLLLDEFDAIGADRSNDRDVAEMRRVVNTLLTAIDGCPDSTVVIAATNLPQLLDEAVFRRFNLAIRLDKPSIAGIVEWLNMFAARHNLQLGCEHKLLAEQLSDLSFAEIENKMLNIYREHLVSDQPIAAILTKYFNLV
jgi:SpoVK/Ycf46/Vps4 family AAA+-type ATPase